MKAISKKPPAQLRFNAHPWWLRIIGLLGALTLILVVLQFWGIFPPATVHSLLGALMFICYVAVIWYMTLGIDQVEIDLTNRTYFLRRGIWPFTAGLSGTLEEVELRLEEFVGRRYWIHIYLVWKDNSHSRLPLWSKDAFGWEGLKSIVPEGRLRAQTLAEQFQIPFRP